MVLIQEQTDNKQVCSSNCFTFGIASRWVVNNDNILDMWRDDPENLGPRCHATEAPTTRTQQQVSNLMSWSFYSECRHLWVIIALVAATLGNLTPRGVLHDVNFDCACKQHA